LNCLDFFEMQQFTMALDDARSLGGTSRGRTYGRCQRLAIAKVSKYVQGISSLTVGKLAVGRIRCNMIGEIHTNRLRAWSSPRIRTHLIRPSTVQELSEPVV
jgi:hypothetical protein